MWPDMRESHNFFECATGGILILKAPGTAYYPETRTCDYDETIPLCLRKAWDMRVLQVPGDLKVFKVFVARAALLMIRICASKPRFCSGRPRFRHNPQSAEDPGL